MLILLAIILTRLRVKKGSNGAIGIAHRRVPILDIAIIGNLRRSRQGPPKYDTYVIVTPPVSYTHLRAHETLMNL
eukprot:4311910-Prymnesium_polylepis.1